MFVTVPVFSSSPDAPLVDVWVNSMECSMMAPQPAHICSYVRGSSSISVLPHEHLVAFILRVALSNMLNAIALQTEFQIFNQKVRIFVIKRADFDYVSNMCQCHSTTSTRCTQCSRYNYSAMVIHQEQAANQVLTGFEQICESIAPKFT